jgi:uncharacterized protein YdeI (YjbR/CyaY-like superfamily)
MIKKEHDIESICPATPKEWRAWLQKNHDKKDAVWLVFYKMKTGKRSISWSEAVDQALCFGWVDSIAKPIDDEQYKQYFGKRKPKSVWSKINKEKIERLLADGSIAEAGMKSVAIAKENGSWNILDEVEELIIPKDLEKEFRSKKGSKAFFQSLSKSVRKAMLQWITMAKRPETRQKRISEIAELAALKQKPKQF